MATLTNNSQVQSQQNPDKKSNSSKVVLIVSLVVGGLVASFLALFVLLVIIGLSADSTHVYKVSDLVPVSNSDITFTRPKQWVDASYVDKLNKDFAGCLSFCLRHEIVTDKNGQTDVIMPL
jgi:hypothetical protein